MFSSFRSAGTVVAIAHTVGDLVGRLEKDLGVNGVGLGVLFCVSVGALIIVLVALDRFSKRRALRLAHIGRFVAHDPYPRSFHLHRSVSDDFSTLPTALNDPVTQGPARDASNPRYRPEIDLPSVPDPMFPSLSEVRMAAAASGQVLSDLLANLKPFDAPAGLSDGSSMGSPDGSSMGSLDTSSVDSAVDSGDHDPGRGSSTATDPEPTDLRHEVAPAAKELAFAVESGSRTTGLTPSDRVGQLNVAVASEVASGVTPDVISVPVAGWYQDPEGKPGDLRYWDGNVWTQRHPA